MKLSGHTQANTDINQTIRQILSTIFPNLDITPAIITRIGGMSNKNYKITLAGKNYVLRIPGNGSEGMVDRENEEINARIAHELGITPAIHYFNKQSGIKLSDFIENVETLHPDSIQDEQNLIQIAAIYQAIHEAKNNLNNPFDIFEEIEKYNVLLKNAGAFMYEGWEDVYSKIQKLKLHLAQLGLECRPCHNDAVPENFIKTQEGRIYLIDWEYSGMNDPMADLAALFLESDFSPEKCHHFLQMYFKEGIPDTAEEKIKCFQILWDYLWSQWTVIKEAKGDDFGSYGIDRFNRAIKQLNTINLSTYEV